MIMKEIYQSPELNLISYVPAENLASSFDVEDLLAGKAGQGGTPIVSGDIGFDF